MRSSEDTDCWSNLRGAGSAANIPAAVLALQNATSVAQAERNYWRIDNTVVVQGMLFEAARPTASLLVGALAVCTLVARPRILELLVQVGSGEPSPSEVLVGNLALAKECRKQVCLGFDLYKQALNSLSEEDLDYCVDLLGLCALENQGHKEQVRIIFLNLMGKPVGKGVQQLINNWMENW